ncbi:FAD/NAD(P)-binding oxidoreductase [Lipingzhangella sp. LS1_29]|uniref:FAD/NAD(P)-binding oxidoreductase n=1 Tax=Lipingzhangella rawalii TaxID=2055835 RepID=A0ABU2H8G1_9ACTN|nr:FAD/NAD(P)-binding oxidoreductase [Lipingzhangella rawalii]MDS1271140.1 FAD/NAD(P)-binding oxidoreductase [Lipingzhangella rawalii]
MHADAEGAGLPTSVDPEPGPEVTVDVAVIGAGPAGLAAAVTAAGAGCTVALVDSGARPGGQFFRQPAPDLAFSPGITRPRHRGHRAFRALTAALSRANHRDDGRVTELFQHHVWHVATDPTNTERAVTLHAAVGEPPRRRRVVHARCLVLATGAYDRTLPFPGWDLPGVLTAGGAQSLIKAQDTPPGHNVVVAGTGPFLLPVAAGLARAGCRVPAVVEASAARVSGPRMAKSVVGAGAHLGTKLVEAAGYAAALARNRIPVYTGHAVVAAHGADRVHAVTLAPVDRDWHPRMDRSWRLPCDTLAVGYGFTPQLELPISLGCTIRTDTDGNLVVSVDADQRTSVPGVMAAGESTGVAGAETALAEGTIAGRVAAGHCGAGAPSRSHETALRRLRAHRSRLHRFAAALHAAYPVPDGRHAPPGWSTWLTEDTIVCRCEDVPLSLLRIAATELGATDARTAKLLARPGMGWCQGRMCGWATTCLTAGLSGQAPTTVELTGTARRPLARPIPLHLLAESTPPSHEGTSDDA